MKVGMLTSGGDCQGLNSALRGVAKTLYNELGNTVTIYGIQDGYPLVRYCEGSYTNVVGLPMERLGVMLCEAQLIQSPAEGTSAKEERSCSN